MDFILVGLGGFIGAVCRYLVYLAEKAISIHSFPLGTLAINVMGSLLAGSFFALVEKSAPQFRSLLLLGSVGFIGSFTTFSTFSVETYLLLKSNNYFFAVLNVLMNVSLGVCGVAVGRGLTLKVV